MRLKAIEKQFITDLSDAYALQEIQSFFKILLETYVGIKPFALALDITKEASPNQKKQFLTALALLKKQVPLQYIIGHTDFLGFNFLVTKDTLIPRPETQELVTWIVEDYKNKQDITIIDIGTGSGCIAISLAKLLPKAKVYAMDVSKKALAVAKKNAQKNKVDITFINQDVLQTDALLQNMDVIVSNPPYVRVLEKAQMHANVLEYEPGLALFVPDANPLMFYDKIADLAVKNLNKNGALYFEINAYLGTQMLAMLSQKGFKSILKQDFYTKDRMTKSVLK